MPAWADVHCQKHRGRARAKSRCSRSSALRAALGMARRRSARRALRHRHVRGRRLQPARARGGIRGAGSPGTASCTTGRWRRSSCSATTSTLASIARTRRGIWGSGPRHRRRRTSSLRLRITRAAPRRRHLRAIGGLGDSASRSGRTISRACSRARGTWSCSIARTPRDEVERCARSSRGLFLYKDRASALAACRASRSGRSATTTTTATHFRPGTPVVYDWIDDL